MKCSIASLFALAASAQAHYTFPALIAGTTKTSEWQYVRQWTGYVSNGPVTDVTKLDIRCNVGASSVSAPGIQTVAAGSQVGFTAAPDIYHPGPLMAYMAKVPAGKTAANWDGSGEVWFKIFEQGPVFGSALTWPNNGYTQAMFTIPASTPPGDYLFRIEHIGLHSASAANGAQFYISCAQVTVTGSGTGKPGPLVAFPGAYKATDPGLMLNIYYPVPTTYTMPGPAVWKG
ncbi:fungal cellulose binding domain-containing protein [Halenospora varia]|nr:fungal cellulose binding domain-containing protein [Halenospora varia]